MGVFRSKVTMKQCSGEEDERAHTVPAALHAPRNHMQVIAQPLLEAPTSTSLWYSATPLDTAYGISASY